MFHVRPAERLQRHPKFMCSFRGFMIWHYFGCIIWTPCLTKVFSCHMWPPIIDCIDSYFSVIFSFAWCGIPLDVCVACDTDYWSLQVSTVHVTPTERPWRCSKFTCIFRGFMMQHLFGCIMRTWCLLIIKNRINRTTYHQMYWFPFFCGASLCMSWTTLTCICCTWYRALIFVSVDGSGDTGWEASKFTWSVYNSCDAGWEASINHVS